MEFGKLSGDALRRMFDKIIGGASPSLFYAREVKI